MAEDCVAGSSLAAHEVSVNAMEYLQTDARRSAATVIAGFGALTLEAKRSGGILVPVRT